jgi:hypothetical protein
MSTPIPPNSKLEGLELYAPRWARAPTSSTKEDQAPQSPPVAPSEPEPQAQQQARPWARADDVETAQARVDDAIQRAIKVCRPSDHPDPVDTAPTLPRAPHLTPKQAQLADRSLAMSDSPRRYRDFGQSGSRRSFRLDPEILPGPPARTQPRVVAPLLARLALVVGFAAAAAYGLTLLSSRSDLGKTEPASETIAANEPTAPDDTTRSQSAAKPQVPARLVVEDQRAFKNEPVALGVSVDRATGHELLLLAGLATGTRLSAGNPLSQSSWELPSSALGSVFMYAPKDFVGVMNTAVNLLASDQKLVDARAVQFAWVTKKPELPSAADRIAPAIPSLPVVRPRDSEQDALLMKRGEDLLNIGDVAGARLAFRHLADAGNAEAALALGVTFDPRYLTQHNVIGVVGDEAKARAWYQRAMELGSTAAKGMLAHMAEK